MKTLVSQNPELVQSMKARYVMYNYYLPWLISTWQIIEKATGIQWRCTSYVRDSPNHNTGYSIDLAPDINPSAKKLYAVYRFSDPVLYKRERLIRQLQSAIPALNKLMSQNGNYDVGIFIEADHLHVMLIAKTSKGCVLTKWGMVKPSYSDTLTRGKLPLITDQVSEQLINQAINK